MENEIAKGMYAYCMAVHHLRCIALLSEHPVGKFPEWMPFRQHAKDSLDLTDESLQSDIDEYPTVPDSEWMERLIDYYLDKFESDWPLRLQQLREREHGSAGAGEGHSGGRSGKGETVEGTGYGLAAQA